MNKLQQYKQLSQESYKDFGNRNKQVEVQRGPPLPNSCWQPDCAESVSQIANFFRQLAYRSEIHNLVK